MKTRQWTQEQKAKSAATRARNAADKNRFMRAWYPKKLKEIALELQAVEQQLGLHRKLRKTEAMANDPRCEPNTRAVAKTIAAELRLKDLSPEKKLDLQLKRKMLLHTKEDLLADQWILERIIAGMPVNADTRKYAASLAKAGKLQPIALVAKENETANAAMLRESGIPKTAAEWDARKQEVTERRKAKRRGSVLS